jgi:hypothetical protein
LNQFFTVPDHDSLIVDEEIGIALLLDRSDDFLCEDT